MANDIQLKRSSVPGKVPDAANVLVGEPVVNLADQILYTKNGTGNIKIIGANLTLQVVDTANTVASSIADVRTIQFDSDSGFDVVDRANGIAKVQMNSTFKTWNVQGQANLVAQGLDVIEFVAGDHIQINTNDGTDPQQIIFSTYIIGDDNAITVLANGLIYFSGVVTVNGANGDVILNTSNIAESGNLYFTNSRVVSALTAGQSITIDANGRINSTVTGGSSSGTVAISDYQVFPGGNSNITLNTPVTDAKSILVTIDGLLQIPTTDYTVNSTTLSWTSIPPANSTVEVKYFITGNAASYSTFTYTGDGTTSSFAAINGITKDNILVFENGIAQVPTTDYIVSGSNVLFTSAPVNGMGIQIRTLGGGGGGSSTGYSLSTLSSFPTGDYGNVLSSSVDAFGVIIMNIYNCMDPLGSIVSEDLGVLT